MMVHVVENLRMPAVQHLFRGRPSLNLSERGPIAVIVVAGIVVPDDNGLRTFVGSAEVFFVPINNKLLSVGILRRHQHDDDVMQNGLGASVVFRCELIGKECDALRTGNLRRVDVRRDREDSLAFCDEFFGLFRRGDPRIG